MSKKVYSIIILSLLIIVVTSCASSPAKETATSIKIEKVSIGAAQSKIFVGENVELVGYGYDKKGTKFPVESTWKIVNESEKIGTLSKVKGDRVLFSAMKPGTAIISMSNQKISTTSAINVEKKVVNKNQPVNNKKKNTIK